MPQLTITLDDTVWQAVQQHAQKHGQAPDKSAADLLQAAVRPVELESAPATSQPAEPTRPFSPRVQRLFGAVRVPEDFDYKQALDEAMQERFGQ